jgi:micrococcal nuclease
MRASRAVTTASTIEAVSRRRATLVLLVAVVAAVAACGDLTGTPAPRATPGAAVGSTPATSVGAVGSPSGRATRTPARPPATPTPTPTRPAAATSPAPGVAARVARVVDGDTLKVTISGRTDTVRVIGLDTPESVKPGTPVECFALQASAEAKLLLPVGGAIRLQADPTQATRDRYGRLLAHVWLADATLFAERMIRGGFGIHDIYEGVPSIYASRLAAAEAAARGALRGLWSPTTCAGNDHTPAP